MIVFRFNIRKMTQYKNTLNLKLPNSQVNKLKSATKNGTELLVILMGKIIFLINYFETS